MASLAVTRGAHALPDPAFWSGRRVLVTGHTGFKGSWLVRWLRMLGADAHGLALDPHTEPSLFEIVGIGGLLASDHRIDLRDSAAVRSTVAAIDPHVVIHLAAQPLVRDAYRDPTATIASNVLGTVHLLQALRGIGPTADGRRRAIVVATTDKVYAPASHRHCESSPLGGSDPYSLSKVMVEHAVTAFRCLPAIDHLPAWDIPIAAARAGNVIGGGDWSHERLIPDCVRSFLSSEAVVLRNPDAVRPWQHVLEPLAGYLLLAEHLAATSDAPVTAVNFGPDPEGTATVRTVAGMAAARWSAGARVATDAVAGQPPETAVLELDSGLAERRLGWRPRWGVREAVHRTMDWYRAHLDGTDMARYTDGQILDYAHG